MNTMIHKIYKLFNLTLLTLSCNFFIPINSIATSLIESDKILSASYFQQNSLRGFNVESNPKLTENDYADLAQSGAKLVRIQITIKKCQDCTYYVISPIDFDMAKKVIKYGNKYGFHVIIAVGTSDGGNQSEYWQDSNLWNSIAQNWRAIALAFKNEQGVAGYDLINEPVPHQLGISSNYIWTNLANQLIETIRTIDPEHAIIVEVAPWDLPSSFSDFKPLPYKNLVYSVHMYDPHELTHQTLENIKNTTIYPGIVNGVLWNKAKLSAALEPVRRFSRTYNVPIYVGEFSCIRFAQKQSASRYIKDLIDIFDKEGWSWTYHQYRGWTGWDAEVDSENQYITLHSSTAPIFMLLKQYFYQDGSPHKIITHPLNESKLKFNPS